MGTLPVYVTSGKLIQRKVLDLLPVRGERADLTSRIH